jgi:hypothetical protein
MMLSLFFAISNGQNLIPNPSFEDTISCPDNVSGQFGDEIYNLLNWFPAANSPDFFNACSQAVSPQNYPLVQVPQNFFGFQYPYHGSAYIGLYNIGAFSDYREYIGVQLTQSLQIGTRYYFNGKVSSGFQGDAAVFTFANNLGILLSTNYFESQVNPLGITNYATAAYGTIIDDTTAWIPLSFSFIADSNYTYLYIGNFFNDANTDSAHALGTLGGMLSYVYLDFFCLSIDSTCNLINNDKEIETFSLTIHPNPVENFAKVQGMYKGKIYLYNYEGKLLTTHIKQPNETLIIDFSERKSGIYLLKTENNSLYKIIKP